MNIYSAPNSEISESKPKATVRLIIYRIGGIFVGIYIFFQSLITYQAATLYGDTGSRLWAYGAATFALGIIFTLLFALSFFFSRKVLIAPLLVAPLTVMLNLWFTDNTYTIFKQSWLYVVVPVVFYFLFGVRPKNA